ncbi:hypothetical protein [uncultured Clostridium sp.]|jgi:hypothetical protein|uniref:hypothetical protein n=1 Tax=uncultured Clostridium sp. TaxID=59620 RepID=UPI0025F78C38|nr:hypothetical protein [uncultured Clostridium sp.]
MYIKNEKLNLGKLGIGRNIKIFPLKNFKKELVPENAEITYDKRNGETFVIMRY